MVDSPGDGSGRGQGERTLADHTNADKAGSQADNLADEAEGQEDGGETQTNHDCDGPSSPTIQCPPNKRLRGRSNERADEIAERDIRSRQPQIGDQGVGENGKTGSLARGRHG
jgi:hypothetical protein